MAKCPRCPPVTQNPPGTKTKPPAPRKCIMSLTPTLLLILDGYGLAPAGPGNAASLARTPNIDRLISLPGATRIDASGRAVGLPAGYMGNSEVGHLNIGAGRIVYQDMTRIDGDGRTCLQRRAARAAGEREADGRAATLRGIAVRWRRAQPHQPPRRAHGYRRCPRRGRARPCVHGRA